MPNTAGFTRSTTASKPSGAERCVLAPGALTGISTSAPPRVELLGAASHAPNTVSADTTMTAVATRRDVPGFVGGVLIISVMGDLPISHSESKRHGLCSPLAFSGFSVCGRFETQRRAGCRRKNLE